MKNTEWLKEQVQEKLLEDKLDGINYFDYKRLKEDIWGLIDQLDTPETLSQEWIDNHTAGSDTIAHYSEEDVPVVTVSDLENLLVPKQEVNLKIQELIEKYEQEDGEHSNPENAWIDDFIYDLKSLIEEEQKYYVLLPEIVDNWRYVSLAPNHWGVTVRYTDTLDDVHEFTEQEIKNYDERYIPFMVPVEEVNND